MHDILCEGNGSDLERSLFSNGVVFLAKPVHSEFASWQLTRELFPFRQELLVFLGKLANRHTEG